ncbi:hypothetical protein C2U72_19710 [Prosthecomicrobium hirschii]|uniref:hypothetical protein n=1 Tax=Prosthecodimorpha hirschii TaxID=665126 RepID=UPI0011284A70|nr:hypothetical protein [Prosthecomicrobium hirschii]TPQ49211.1 hypothetical protein C2U72_19710 [Prosthecomicrobium hirschii]
MIAFHAKDLESALSNIREEVRRSVEDGHGDRQFVLIPAEQYLRLRETKIIDLREVSPDLLDEMARQLDEAIDRRPADDTSA